MAALDSLKVTRAPGALAETARAVNALIDLISEMQGSGGTTVTVSEGLILIKSKTTSSSSKSYSTYTFTACVSGSPKTFVIPIVSGPT